METLQPYLVQRGKIQDGDHKKGLDSLVYFSYMGSSEFEWGALPESLKRIRKNKKEYGRTVVPITTCEIVVFHPSSRTEQEIFDYIDLLHIGQIRLKERSSFRKGDEFNPQRTDFWWDIENDIMFWVDDNKFEEKFKKVI